MTYKFTKNNYICNKFITSFYFLSGRVFLLAHFFYALKKNEK